MKRPLIVPLGKAVEEVLEIMIGEGLIKREQCLLGFPHPSGANGHRKKQFEINKDNFLNIIDKYFEGSDNNKQPTSFDEYQLVSRPYGQNPAPDSR